MDGIVLVVLDDIDAVGDIVAAIRGKVDIPLVAPAMDLRCP